MMSKEKRRVPKLRFPGFTEDWEQRKLSDITDVIMGQSPSSKNYTDNPNDNILVQGNADLKDGKVIPRLWTKEITKTIDKDGIILTVRAPVGDVAKTDYKVVLGRGVAGIKGNDFIYQFLQKLQYNRHWVSLSSGSTFESINSNDIKDLIIDIPSIEEQNKISMLLNNVNSIITLHQRKLDNLKLKKKALLQKIFPKNGERYPELRFPGFTDAWEQRKLTDIAKTFIGLVTTMTENYRDSGTLLIRNSDIKEGQFIFSEKPIHLDEEFAEKNKTRRLQIGDVVTVHTGDIGTSAVIQEKEAGAIGFATINTRTDKRILNPYFLSTYFNTEKHKCYANSVSTGDGRSNYNIKDFNKLVISIPTLDEQEKISVLINNINTIITLHQRKLDHLKLQKKALLQQLFV